MMKNLAFQSLCLFDRSNQFEVRFLAKDASYRDRDSEKVY